MVPTLGYGVDTCGGAAVAAFGSCFGVSALAASRTGWEAGSLCGEIEVLEKEWAKEVLVLLDTFGCGGQGALTGGGGMLESIAVVAHGVVASRDLTRPLVLRGEGAIRKSTRVCSAPELLET